MISYFVFLQSHRQQQWYGVYTKMVRLIVVVACMLVVAESGDYQTGDKNTKWRQNDLLLSNIENFYKSLAIMTRESSDTRKRFSSVISLALMFYASSKKATDLERVREAVAKTKRQLGKSADAIAGLKRSYIVILRVALDRPIDDIKVACTPDTEEADCVSKLQSRTAKNKAACPQFNRNLAMYSTSKALYTSVEFSDFFRDLKRISFNPDIVALSYFSHSFLVEYPNLGRLWRNVYQELTNTTFPCNTGTLPFF